MATAANKHGHVMVKDGRGERSVRVGPFVPRRRQRNTSVSICTSYVFMFYGNVLTEPRNHVISHMLDVCRI